MTFNVEVLLKGKEDVVETDGRLRGARSRRRGRTTTSAACSS